MNAEFFTALTALESERGIPKDYMLEKIRQALLKAVKEQMKKAGTPAAAEGAEVILDETKKDIEVNLCRTIVADDIEEQEAAWLVAEEERKQAELEAQWAADDERDEAEEKFQAELDAKVEAGELAREDAEAAFEEFQTLYAEQHAEPDPEDEDGEGTEERVQRPRWNPHIMIKLEEARAIDPLSELGGIIREPLKTMAFGRIAAQAAKQVVVQGIREAEREMAADTLSGKENEMLSAFVTRIDNRTGAIYVKVSGMTERAEELVEAVLPPEEQVRGEEFYDGDRVKVYMLQVVRERRGPQAIVSRTHAGLVRRLFELEVPEVADGTVEIKAVSREPGLRSKIAVISNNVSVDAVGACVGEGGNRVRRIVAELRGEQVDVVPFHEDAEAFVAAALAPAEVYSVVVEPGTRRCRVVCPDNQLSLAIGKEGKNAKLAAKLTGFKIDIRPASEALDYSRLNTK
ncbi:MAG: transcription termination factor NusA [Oscillospiraceae bacterium]|jgi:N utilization substance protein A|nr:transcription termination factor NusA [Oscillospiraceae bacterium]